MTYDVLFWGRTVSWVQIANYYQEWTLRLKAFSYIPVVSQWNWAGCVCLCPFPFTQGTGRVSVPAWWNDSNQSPPTVPATLNLHYYHNSHLYLWPSKLLEQTKLFNLLLGCVALYCLKWAAQMFQGTCMGYKFSTVIPFSFLFGGKVAFVPELLADLQFSWYWWRTTMYNLNNCLPVTLDCAMYNCDVTD